MFSRIFRHIRGHGVAYLAVFLALGGTAVAAQQIRTSQIKNGAVTTSKIRNGAVTKPKLASSVRRFMPVAYAHIDGFSTGSDTVDNARSKGIRDSNVKHPNEGVYCFYHLGFTPKDIQATESFDGSSNGNNVTRIVTFTTDNSVCSNTPSTEDAGIIVYETSDQFGLHEDANLDVVMY